MFYTLTGNFGTLLPIDWSKSFDVKTDDQVIILINILWIFINFFHIRQQIFIQLYFHALLILYLFNRMK